MKHFPISNLDNAVASQGDDNIKGGDGNDILHGQRGDDGRCSNFVIMEKIPQN